MTPRKGASGAQKSKRWTSKPRAGTRRTKAPASNGAPPGEPSLLPEANRDRAHRWSRTYATRRQLADDMPVDAYPQSLEELHPAALEQFEQARKAAFAILDSGSMGSAEVVTIISGQGNAEHKPTNGQPNDAITVSLRQVGS